MAYPQLIMASDFVKYLKRNVLPNHLTFIRTLTICCFFRHQTNFLISTHPYNTDIYSSKATRRLISNTLSILSIEYFLYAAKIKELFLHSSKRMYICLTYNERTIIF